ncbi:MAG: DUF4296 domain-containing protein [Mariniphaga sp.]|nr:DUF4296 domain-containing protein [Mariniphaga sp.]
MKRIILLFSFMAFFFCSKPVVEKPELLIQENKMIDMLADFHLAEATFNARRHRDSLVMKSSSADFYYSILDKHQVPDSVFEQSFVFYVSQPRKFEKMYRQVMNKLNEMEQEYSGRKTDPQELELQRNR